MENVNCLYFCAEKYHNDEYAMWNDVSELLRILAQNEQIAVVRRGDMGKDICVEYNYDDKTFGAAYPMWLTDEDQDLLYFAQQDAIEEVNKLVEDI